MNLDTVTINMVRSMLVLQCSLRDSWTMRAQNYAGSGIKRGSC